MIKYKVNDFEKLVDEYHFMKANIPTHGDVMYLPMPHKEIVLYVVVRSGILTFERNLVGAKSSTDFSLFEKCKYNMLEDHMKATRLVAELEFNKVIEKVEDEKL